MRSILSGDIIACIRALFGDPDFASVLVFQPEKHYVDEKREERMYHRHTDWTLVVVHAGEYVNMDPQP